MKKLLFIICLLFTVSLAAQNPATCKCTYPLKQNTSWCTGPKGGKYCINKNGGKTYMPKKKDSTTIDNKSKFFK